MPIFVMVFIFFFWRVCIITGIYFFMYKIGRLSDQTEIPMKFVKATFLSYTHTLPIIPVFPV